MDNRLYNVKPPKWCEPDEKPSKCCELYEIVYNIVKENVKGKQNKLIAGLNITIKDDIISATVGGGIEQQQANWAQTDNTAVDFIKHKPDLNVYVPKMDDDGHGMTIYSPGGITMFVADEQGTFNQTGTFGAGGWSVSSPDGKFQTFGNSIYRGTMGFDHDSVVWEKTATQQIPVATTSANGLMAAVDKSKLNDLPTDAELTQELAGKQDTINDLAAIRSGAQAGATAYQKPNTGIPATDLASDVQTDLAAIDTIEEVIPEQASSSNQLADKNFVNSSIATATATYRGSYNLVTDLHLSVSATHAQIATALATAIQTADNNDYCFVQIPTADDTPTEIARIDRYKYDGTAWAYEYSLNNSSFTAAQWEALNSGITSGLVAKLSTLPTYSELVTLLNGKANTDDLAAVATSGSYNDLADKPTIPTVPTNVSAFTNDAGYLTQHQDITSKADKVSGATNGNFAALDSNGNLIDSGHKHSDYLTQHQDLSNYVQKSNTQGLLKNDGTVDTTQYLSQHQDISGKEDITPIVAVASGTTAIIAEANTYYEVVGTVSSLTVTLPTPTVNTEVTMVVVHLTVGASPTVVVTSVNEVVKFSAAYSVVANKEYELSCLYNGSKWIVSSMEVAV